MSNRIKKQFWFTPEEETDKIHTLRVGKKYVIPKKSVIDFLAA